MSELAEALAAAHDEVEEAARRKKTGRPYVTVRHTRRRDSRVILVPLLQNTKMCTLHTTVGRTAV